MVVGGEILKNPIQQYKEYKDLMNTLSRHNTMDIARFIKMTTNEKFMVLFSHVLSTKIRVDIQFKLLMLILGVLCGSTFGVFYSIMG